MSKSDSKKGNNNNHSKPQAQPSKVDIKIRPRTSKGDEHLRGTKSIEPKQN